jgi:transposase-like protein
MNTEVKVIRRRKRYSQEFKNLCLKAIKNGATRKQVQEMLGVPAGTLTKWISEARQIENGMRAPKVPKKRGQKSIVNHALLDSIIIGYPKANFKQLTSLYNNASGASHVCISTIRNAFMLLKYKKLVHQKQYIQFNPIDESISKKKFKIQKKMLK